MRRAVPVTLAEEVAAAPELTSPNVQAHLARAAPGLVPRGLATNPNLTVAVWEQVYTFRPKVRIETAVAMVAHPLTPEQVEHLLRGEKRVAVWEELMRHTPLPKETVRTLGRADLVSWNARVRSSRRTLPAPARSLFTLSEEAAGKVGAGALRDPQLRGAVVNHLVAALGEDTGAWEVLVALVDEHVGSVAELEETVLRLCE